MSGRSSSDLREFIRQFDNFLKLFKNSVSIIYLPPKTEIKLSGKVYVYKGVIKYNEDFYESGESLLVKGGVVSEEESILLVDERDAVLPPAYRTESPIVEVIRGEPVTVPENTSIREAARVMAERSVSSVVIVSDDGYPLAIFTDTDLRRAVASGVDLNRLVSFVSSKELVVVEETTSSLEALIKMTMSNVKHLIVVDGRGRLRGVVTMRDIAYRMAPIPLHTIRDLRRVKSADELRRHLREVSDWALRASQALMSPEAPHPLHLTKAISYINDEIMRIVIDEVVNELGHPPHPFCVVVTGSQGVYEQFVVTDMDNFIITAFEDKYYKDLGSNVIKKLLDLGYPTCKDGNTMDSLQFPVYKIDEIIESSGDKDVILMNLIFDGRVIYGHRELLDKAKDVVHKIASQNRARVLSNSLCFKPPLTTFDRIRRTFKPKEEALAPLSMPVRALSMILGITSETIPERIAALADRWVISRELEVKLREAYEVLLKISIWAKSQNKQELNVDDVPLRDELKSALRAVKLLHDKLEREPV
ncbi:MAG: CBS domain-containing protein [Thaumarchaeota archaeon]|nr:CBS domain-containing protein [Candidatus Calditenuaceae archaeon]MDW8041442.1 CBS domain-containing protein [Nitrososphaerota archaeon]